jgi:hypothetical protein
MGFWSDASAGSIPRRNFRFLVSLSQDDGDDGAVSLPVWVAKAATLPQITVSDAGKVHFLNHEFKFPGRVTYQDVNVTLVDAIDKNISMDVLKFLANGGYQVPSKVAAAGEFETAARQTIVFKNELTTNVEITQLGAPMEGAGAVINDLTFVLKNAFAKTVVFPQGLDYSSEDVSDVKITFAYDYFTVKHTGTAVNVPDGFADAASATEAE